MENTKSNFTISELAKELDVKKSHIRFCEEKGLISPKVTMMKRRIYNEHDRARLNLIFHCVLINYSQDQIVELIGTPDENLDEMEQFRKSLEYGEKKLDELEKRSKDSKFHERSSVINEINMMRKYVDELKNIKPAIFDEHAAEPHIQEEGRKEEAPKPVETIKVETEKKIRARNSQDYFCICCRISSDIYHCLAFLLSGWQKGNKNAIFDSKGTAQDKNTFCVS